MGLRKKEEEEKKREQVCTVVWAMKSQSWNGETGKFQLMQGLGNIPGPRDPYVQFCRGNNLKLYFTKWGLVTSLRACC